MLKTVLSAHILLVLSAGGVFAHELGNVPCNVTPMSTLILFGFDTFESENVDLNSLQDGKISIGIEMKVDGENLDFTKSFSIKYQKTGNNFVGPGSNWGNQSVKREVAGKIGSFPIVSCSILGYGAAE